MSGKKIKIALCISGEPRSTMVSFSYIYETFLQPNSYYETDVYVHTREPFRALNLYHPKKIFLDDKDDKHLINFTFESQKSFMSPELKKKLEDENVFNSNTRFIKHQILMWEGIYQSLKLAFENENNIKYDLFIRCRPDMIFRGPCNLDSVFFNLANNKYDLFIPSPTLNQYSMIKDTLAIGNYSSMKIYSEIYLKLFSLYSRYNTIFPEKLLNHVIEENEIRLNSYPINDDLVRQAILKTADTKPYTYNE